MKLADQSIRHIYMPGERDYYAPAWSPDGKHIAFVTYGFDKPMSEDIAVVNADGTNPRILVKSQP